MNQNISKQCVSFVIPLFNESQCLEELYARISQVMQSLDEEFELICVDDCSNDATLSILRKLRKNDPRVKIISFSRNFGHQIAVLAGLNYAHGDCVVIMDGDLQDPPEIVGAMLKKWREDFDVVYGVRRNRKEGRIKVLLYQLFYWLIHRLSSLRIPLDAGDFCLVDRRVVAQMIRLREERPFVRGLRSWVGFKQVGVEYERAARAAGDPKYSIAKLFKLAFDGILSFSSLPLELTIIIGSVISFASVGYAIFIGINRILIWLGIIHVERIIPGWATLVCSIMFLVGLQFIFLGILGEYIGRIFIQTKNRPLYIVQEEEGF